MKWIGGGEPHEDPRRTEYVVGLERENKDLKAELDEARGAIDALCHEVTGLREQLRLAIVDAAQVEAEANDLRAERDELRRHSDPASYSAMVYWQEKCFEARAEVDVLRSGGVGMPGGKR